MDDVLKARGMVSVMLSTEFEIKYTPKPDGSYAIRAEIQTNTALSPKPAIMFVGNTPGPIGQEEIDLVLCGLVKLYNDILLQALHERYDDVESGTTRPEGTTDDLAPRN